LLRDVEGRTFPLEVPVTKEKILVKEPFLPASASRSYHVYCEAGDELTVEQEYDHGTMCRKQGVMCFLLEEEVHRFCKRVPA